MGDPADLEICLRHRGADSYFVELRFSEPGSDVDFRLVADETAFAHFDFQELQKHNPEEETYGRVLTASLFSVPKVHTAFVQARTRAESKEPPLQLRLRLYIAPSALELHRLRWETLQDPETHACFATSERVLFSRYLSSRDWRPAPLRPKDDLRALVVIANPSNLSEYRLSAIPVAEELARAKVALGELPVQALASGGTATLNNLSAHLREGYDILYLLSHGGIVDGEPRLWLEDERGGTERIRGSDLAARFAELRQVPRLVVLASCQSAGSDHGETLTALGPRLAEVGVPAILAMQDVVSMETVERFMSMLFRELQRDGQVDRAVAVARGEVRKQPYWWVPVLFTRLKSGRVWYVRGFAEPSATMKKWKSVTDNIRLRRCTPILGPGLAEFALGSRREIARRWAKAFHFPMQAHLREDLHQVAQYLAIDQQDMAPRDELMEYVARKLQDRYPEETVCLATNASVDEILSEVGKKRRAKDPNEPHRLLAALGLPLYITTNPGNLLADAIREAGREPAVEICRWRRDDPDVADLESVFDRDKDYRPHRERPLIYHLFGHLSVPASLVLTEDDYFDYLIGVTADKNLIPQEVRRMLVDSGLLFLGFQLDDWDFRVLLRSILKQEGNSRLRRFAHVAAQIDPEEGRILEPERARRYLEDYFRHDRNVEISIYWGRPEDFLKELNQQLART